MNMVLYHALNELYIAGNRKLGVFLCRDILYSKIGILISDFTSLRVARRGDAESEVFFERTPLGLCELSTSTYNLGQGGAKKVKKVTAH